MSYVNIPTRTTADLNAAGDINQLMINNNFILSKIYTEITTEIEMLKVHSVFCDPLNIPNNYLIADGSTFPSLSEANVIHNSGGIILSGTPFEKTYTGKGLTRIPDVLGYSLRYAALGRATDPDRNDRRQAVTGTVDSSSGVVVYLPAYYINIIKNAFDNSRSVVIGQTPAIIFDALTVYGTVTAVNTTLNYVVLTAVTGTFTAGTGRSLIIKGDVVGSFQNDAFQSHLHSYGVNRTNGNVGLGYTLQTQELSAYLSVSAPTTDGSYGTPRATSETRTKNISLLPLVRVYI